jgi:uncharacterized membrane protein
MKWVWLVGGLAVCIGVGTWLYASRLPATVTTVREAIVQAPVDRVFALVTDVANQHYWRSDIGRITVTEDGASWVEHTRSGDDISFQAVDTIPNSKFEIVYQSKLGFSGRWVGTFTRRDAQTTVIRIEETTTTPSVMGRLLGRIFAPPGSHTDLYLSDLTKTVR